ncbi:MAG TPA: hypothetical protein VF669_14590 [Tepidisphaeraceae bacterium]|jgi:hypothetical protein
MYKPISTKMHGILDFLTVGAFLTVPRLLPCKQETRDAITALALGKLGYALLTRHELGLYKLIPMKAHLVMDSVGGASLAAIPFVTDEDDFSTTAFCLGMGMFDIAAAPMTETQMPADHYAVNEDDLAQYRVSQNRSANRGTAQGLPASSMRDTGAHATSGL